MGKPTATARRGANGEVEYDLRVDEVEEAPREGAELQGRNSQLGGVSGGRGQAALETDAAPRSGNPGMADTQSNGEPDLSTSDNTTRRKAGYRRDSGIRI